MIRRLLARFGYYPVDVVDDAWDSGRRCGVKETLEDTEREAFVNTMMYDDLLVHHNRLLRYVSDISARQVKTPIYIKGDPKHGLH